MIKANSLLYAVYVCLIVALLCAGLLWVADMYRGLNIHYTTQESSYIKHYSMLNYSLGENLNHPQEEFTDDKNEIKGQYSIKKHGILTVMTLLTYRKKDTIKSVHFVGQESRYKNTALYMANFTQPLSLSGKVTLSGELWLPHDRIKESYIHNKPNHFVINGQKKTSQIQLPQLTDDCQNLFESLPLNSVSFNQLEKLNDSIYINSFNNETILIRFAENKLSEKNIKGNFILKSNDSIFISKNNLLDDVIVMAPKVVIEEGFEGTLQIIAEKSIHIQKNVSLNYPSVVALSSKENGKIIVEENTKIAGLALLCGNDFQNIDKNIMELKPKGLVMGTLYCSGTLTLQNDVYGSVFTNKLLHKTQSSSFSNTLADVTIDISKKPKVFIDMPIFDNQNATYAIIKKVL